MKKIISFLLVITMLAATGCSGSNIFGDKKGERPYGSLYDDAKDWAKYWCGPCKQLDMETVPNEPHDIEIYIMKDKEYGFKYQVEAMYMDYATSLTPEPSYTAASFDYEYLKVYLDETDFSEIVDKYDLTIELEEIRMSYDGKCYDPFYSPHINCRTDRELNSDEKKEILSFVYNTLKDFDKDRGHFTRNEYCKDVYFYVWSAPSASEQANGQVKSSEHGIFGYRSEHR